MSHVALKNHVTDELFWDPKVDNAAIAVSTDDGVVTLRGTVGSLRQKREAKKDAERVWGVKNVNNDLQVVVDVLHAPDALGVLLGLALLPQAADGSAEGHHAIVRGDRNRCVVDLWVPEELVGDVARQLVVGHLPLLSLNCRSSPCPGDEAPTASVQAPTVCGKAAVRPRRVRRCRLWGESPTGSRLAAGYEQLRTGCCAKSGKESRSSPMSPGCCRRDRWAMSLATGR